MGALLPQAATVASAFSARLKTPPAATAMALLSVEGTLVWPKSLYPHAVTLPSLRRAILCEYVERETTCPALAATAG